MTPDPAALGRELRPHWDEVRHRRVLRGIQEGLEAQEQAKSRPWLLWGGMVTAAAAAGVLGWFATNPRQVTEQPVATNDTPVVVQPSESGTLPAVRLAEGISGTLSNDAEVSIIEQSASRLAVSQANGTVRYSVDPNRGVEFEVTVRGVHVKVLGTVFEVTSEDRLVTVDVERGQVQVTHLGGISILSKDQRGEFYGEEAPETEDEQTVEEPSATQKARARRTRATPPPEPVSVQELLRRADEARAEGHDAEAAAQLRELLRAHPKSTQVIAARFTLGRIETARGRFLVAAKQFEEVRKLAPNGPLAEDALAEEAWSRHRGGDGVQARALAQKYLDHYATGPHHGRMSKVLETSDNASP